MKKRQIKTFLRGTGEKGRKGGRGGFSRKGRAPSQTHTYIHTYRNVEEQIE